MPVGPRGSAEILLPVLLQLSLWDGVGASCMGLSSVCFACLTLTCTLAGTLRLGVWICASPGWPAGCNFLAGLEAEIKILSHFLNRNFKKKKKSILYYLECDTFIFTMLKRTGLQYVFKCLELGILSQRI